MIGTRLILASLAVMTLAATALAVPTPTPTEVPVDSSFWTGTRNSGTGGGVTGTEAWDDGGFWIEWDITQNGTNSFTYSYTFYSGVDSDGDLVALTKALSHWIFEVSRNFTSDNIDDITGATEVDGPGTVVPSGDSKPNPYMPSDIFGIKFGGASGVVTHTFWSDRRPMWGDFYAVDGKDGVPGDKEWVYAHNIGFGQQPTPGTDGNYLKWIPVPDTVGGEVPEPGTMVLLGSGLLGLGILARRRRKNRKNRK